MIVFNNNAIYKASMLTHFEDADNVSTEFEFKSSPSTQLRALECNGVHLRLLYQMQLFINLLFHVCRYSP